METTFDKPPVATWCSSCDKIDGFKEGTTEKTEERCKICVNPLNITTFPSKGVELDANIRV